VQLAVFDLDGTITRRDTLFPYVAGYLSHEPWRLPGMLKVAPAAARFAVGKSDHGELKSAFIKSTLAGCTRADLLRWTERFVHRLLGDGLFAEARRRISAHRHAGDRLVLMSASVDLYVPAVGRALGFHEVICTGVLWEGDRLRGDLTTPNRRGAEKARCFQELQRRYPQLTTVAYGNAASDLDHLRLAHQGFLVNGSRTARQMAATQGVTYVSWR
jgi:phosphatidylglycerophosphatase C